MRYHSILLINQLDICKCCYFLLQFWETICEEHDLDHEGNVIGKRSEIKHGKLGVYFNEVQRKNGSGYVPRTVLIDLEPGALDNIRGGLTRRLYKPENFVVGEYV